MRYEFIAKDKSTIAIIEANDRGQAIKVAQQEGIDLNHLSEIKCKDAKMIYVFYISNPMTLFTFKEKTACINFMQSWAYKNNIGYAYSSLPANEQIFDFHKDFQDSSTVRLKDMNGKIIEFELLERVLY